VLVLCISLLAAEVAAVRTEAVGLEDSLPTTAAVPLFLTAFQRLWL